MRDKKTTIAGILKSVAWGTVTVQNTQHELVFWFGLIMAILEAVGGYLQKDAE